MDRRANPGSCKSAVSHGRTHSFLYFRDTQICCHVHTGRWKKSRCVLQCTVFSMDGSRLTAKIGANVKLFHVKEHSFSALRMFHRLGQFDMKHVGIAKKRFEQRTRRQGEMWIANEIEESESVKSLYQRP